jgi:hypothetical protein
LERVPQPPLLSATKLPPAMRQPPPMVVAHPPPMVVAHPPPMAANLLEVACSHSQSAPQPQMRQLCTKPNVSRV